MPETPDRIGDDAALAVYNRELMALSARAEIPKVLPSPDTTARAISPVCGSVVDISLSLNQGKITAIGYTVDACAITRATVAVLSKAAIGKTREEVAQAAQSLRHLLKEGTPMPAGDWQGLDILLPVKDYTARHNAVLLPFEAIEKAFLKKI